MRNNFDPVQESYEEYLRRIHLDGKLNNNEWKIDEEEKEFNNKTITEPE